MGLRTSNLEAQTARQTKFQKIPIFKTWWISLFARWSSTWEQQESRPRCPTSRIFRTTLWKRISIKDLTCRSNPFNILAKPQDSVPLSSVKVNFKSVDGKSRHKRYFCSLKIWSILCRKPLFCDFLPFSQEPLIFATLLGKPSSLSRFLDNWRYSLKLKIMINSSTK